MAKRYWGINQGQHQTDVVEATTSQSTNVEVNIDLSIGMSRDEIFRALDMIREEILMDVWPPA